VGCGTRAVPDALVRFAAPEGRVLPDAERRRGGRGAWLHRDAACLERAVRRGAFGRALRRHGLAVDADELGRLLTGIGRRD
jgi:uncharacterized protein